MSFNSLDYLLFFPIVILLYYVIPKRIRVYWLLAASYFFYFSWSARHLCLLVITTITTYLCGLLLDYKTFTNQAIVRKAVLFVCILFNLGILFYFKYYNFVVNSINKALQGLLVAQPLPVFDIVLPVGISFYIFQSLGYVIDVYRGDAAEKNPFRYALFVSFFPQLVAGPIERSKNLLNQFRQQNDYNVEQARYGLLTIAYGLFLKMVVSDNIASVIDPVFARPDDFSGMALLFATMLFSFQIYCDFNGYTQIAIGSAQILGFHLNKNFSYPYMSLSVKEFWKRWHISLTSWFRDYLYIPLGGNRNGKMRKHINTISVFLLSGLWHGAAWHYVFWGGINGLLLTVEDIIHPYAEKIETRLRVDTSRFMYRLTRRTVAFFVVTLTWLFFRAASLKTAVHMLAIMIKDFRMEWLLNFEFASLFESNHCLMVIVFSLLIVIGIDIAAYCGKDIRAIILEQQIIFRWVVYIGIILTILLWGVYGTEYEQKQFIYFQF